MDECTRAAAKLGTYQREEGKLILHKKRNNNNYMWFIFILSK